MQNKSKRKETFVQRITRVSGSFIPGLYCKTKIIPTFISTKRKIYNYPGLSHFKKELQFIILKHLNAKGGYLKSGRFTISSNMEKHLKKNYSISKRWKKSQVILEDLGIISKIYKSSNAIRVTDFNLKFCNRRTMKVQVEVGFF